MIPLPSHQAVVIRTYILVGSILHPEATPFCLFQTICDQLFTNMLPTAGRCHRIACITDMTASAYVVGMQDIKSCNLLPVIHCYTAIALGSKKFFSRFFIQKFFLGKGNSFLHDLIPDPDHCRKIPFFILSDFHVLQTLCRYFAAFLFSIISLFSMQKKHTGSLVPIISEGLRYSDSHLFRQPYAGSNFFATSWSSSRIFKCWGQIFSHLPQRIQSLAFPLRTVCTWL